MATKTTWQEKNVGVSRGRKTRVRVDRNRDATVTVTDHADGRTDVTVQPKTYRIGRVK